MKSIVSNENVSDAEGENAAQSQRTDATTLRACDCSTWVSSPFLAGLSLLFEIEQLLFFKACNTLVEGRFLALQSVARVSHPTVAMLKRPTDSCRPSLNLFSGRPMLLAPAQRRRPSSEGTCCPSKPNVQPTTAVLS